MCGARYYTDRHNSPCFAVATEIAETTLTFTGTPSLARCALVPLLHVHKAVLFIESGPTTFVARGSAAELALLQTRLEEQANERWVAKHAAR